MKEFPKEQVHAAYRRAPEAVQAAFGSETTADIVMDLKTKYRLHVDTAGSLGKEIGYLLLGMRSPAEFFGNLMLEGADEQTARGIMQEVNERIFMPLKRQMTSSEAPARPIETYAPVTAPARAPQPEAAVSAPSIEYPPAQSLPGSSEPVPQKPDASSNLAATAEPAPALTPEGVSGQKIIKEYASDPYREAIT